MYAIRSYYGVPDSGMNALFAEDSLDSLIPETSLARHAGQQPAGRDSVITSYSIHYTKLYDSAGRHLSRA